MVQYKEKLYKPNGKRQYRSAIFVNGDEQKKIATLIVNDLQVGSKQTIHVDIESVGPFYQAEEYHQNFLSKRF